MFSISNKCCSFHKIWSSTNCLYW